MFYACEKRFSNSRGRLTRAILQVPNSTLRRIRRLSSSRSCYQAKLPRFQTYWQPTQDPTGNCYSGYNKIRVAIQAREAANLLIRPITGTRYFHNKNNPP